MERRVVSSQLRQRHPEIGQIGRFDNVAAALTGAQTRKRTVTSAFQVSVDDLWDWEWGEVTALAGQQVTLLIPPPAPQTAAHPRNPPKSQFRHPRTKAIVLAYDNALATGDTTTDVAV